MGSSLPDSKQKLHLNKQFKLNIEKQIEITRQLFPVDEKVKWTKSSGRDNEHIPDVTTEEITNTVENLKKKRRLEAMAFPLKF